MKFYKALIATSILIGGTTFNAGAQNLIYDWGYKWGNTGADQGTCLATDSDGNVIVVSEITGSFDADPGIGVSTIPFNGVVDIAISKFDSDGNLIWAKGIGGPGNDRTSGIYVDNANNIYLTGGFEGTVDFDPNAGTQLQTSAGGRDIYILKLNDNGDLQWVYTNGTAQNEDGRDVAVDNGGNVYATGYFRNTMDFDIGIGVANYTSFGGADVYMLKLSSAGAYISNYQIGGTTDDDPNGIDIDDAGNIYVTGYFTGTADFDGGVGSTPLTATGSDLFITRINANNTYGWAHQIGAAGSDLGVDVTVDNSGDICVGGYFSATVDFDPSGGVDNKTSVGGLDMLLVKFDNAGNYLMGVAAGGIYDDLVGDVVFDSDNNIITTGFMRGTVDFDPGPGTQNVSVTAPANFADQFYWKLDEDGNYVWAEHVGAGNNDHGFAVATHGQFLYTTGYFQGTADFDLTAGVANISSTGSADVSFVKHINCNPIHTNDVIVSCGPITWIDGNTYSSDNNSATHVLTNQYGCDSTVHLNLTIKSIDNQSVTPSATTLCDNGNVTVDLGSSQAGVFYSLVNQSTSTVIDGPIEGNGSALTFDAGTVTSTTTYEIQAERNKYNALTFTGNSATPTHVSLGNDMNKIFAGTTAITVEAWINTDNSNNLQTVVSSYTGLGNTMQFLLRIDQTGGFNKAAFWIGTGTTPGSYTQVAGTTTILPDTWYHLAGSYDGSFIYIYVNGVLENQVAVTTPIPNVTNDVRIGGGLNSNTEYFYGDITGVRIWNVARTESEISDNMDQCIAGNTAGLVAMYNMVDGTGSSMLTDESVNGYDGTLLNMDANTSWNYTNMPAITCSMCYSTMSTIPTVTVNQSSTGTDTQEHCASYTWIDGNTYTASNNTAQHTLTNSVGCDSVVTLNLTINQPNTGIDVQEHCITYTWIDGNTYTTSNTAAQHTLTNAAGCDSVVTLNLTINQPNTGVDVQNVCESLTWIDGNTYTADNNTAQFTLTNMAGCDSVVTLNLTVGGVVANAVNNGDGTMSATGAGTYQWIDCGTNTPIAGATSATFIPTANGDYAVIVTSGTCDDTSACVNYNSVSLNENNQSVFTAYPNPTTGLITINSNNAVIAKVVVRDAAGRVIFENSNTSSLSSIDLTEMENGIYFITVFDANQSQTTMKVIKK